MTNSWMEMWRSLLTSREIARPCAIKISPFIPRSAMLILETSRLVLRPWRDSDRAPFAAVNADAQVRQYYYPSLLTAAETDELIDEANEQFAKEGFGFLAVERKADGALIGGAGLSRPGPEVPGDFPLEIGWILGRTYWRKGYASEISRRCLDFAWQELRADCVIGYTSAINIPSRRAMEAIGMIQVDGGDFDDITVSPGNILRPHVLYRIDRPKQEIHA
ncbi:GNAT family N-acetyltransferase [Rhizobium sp. ZPR3]|uniref:GNAT family N-acetyltransferase n=2 Tax=unclassified Rhizobium TaxID=2613769 RepID=A0AAU7SJH9_9HYPH